MLFNNNNSVYIVDTCTYVHDQFQLIPLLLQNMIGLALTKLRLPSTGLQKAVTFTQSRLSSSSNDPYREEKIVLTEDGTIIACWHPPPKFPYEMSRPIQRQENLGTSSPLKVETFNFSHDGISCI